MEEVQFRVDEVATLLELKHETVLRYIRGRLNEAGERVDRRFPHAYIPHGAPKLGYRIPESDLVAYARTQGPWLVEKVERELRKQREANPTQSLQAV